jgi:recombinational DNA repair protein RecT
VTTLQAVLQSARLGLTLGTEAYLVPFKIKATDKRPEYVSASLIPGYKGMIALAQRLHGIQIIADVICVGDEYEEAFGLVTHHKHSLTPGVVIAAYAIARHPSWVQPVGVFLPRQAIEKRNKGGNFWGPYFARMARKTAVRDLWNSGYLPQNDVRLREVMDLQYPENAITPPPVRQIAAVTRLELTADTSPIETTATEEEVF